MYTIGTAGHVDHGKSALVKALTGIDPDRLREEKERGLTIDLGFAWLKLPSGQEVSIVDVPGHERFIKNMLAGVGGIDLALLVIAADEGVMPQTREHLAIVDLLDIRRGLVVVTKKDLVDGDWLALVKADAAEVVGGTTLEGAPVLTCSAVTGEGLDEMVAAIEAELAQTPAKRDIGRPRLPVDRAFTVAGFGTVATGTLVDGSFELGQEVEVVPGGLRSRIRGLHTHGRKIEKAPPGRRTAVNLPGIAVEELRRGMVVTTPGWLRPARTVDVRLRAVSYLPRAVRHNTEVTFHTGAAEVTGRLLLLDREELRRGESGWAQLRLQEPVAVVKGDRFVIRDPNDTLGGGKVVDVHVRRHRRHDPPTLATLEMLDRGSPEELVRAALARLDPVELAELSRQVELPSDELQATVTGLTDRGEVVLVGGPPLGDESLVATAAGFASLTARVREALAGYHRERPLRSGMPREDLRRRLGLQPRPLEQIVGLWVEQGDVREHAGALSLPEHEPEASPAQRAEASAFLAALQSDPHSPPTDRLPDPELLAYLEDRGEIVRVSDGVVFGAEAYRQMVERIVSHLREQGTITLAQVRDIFGTSRKYAQALLEHMDEQRITRRVGDERRLRKA
ncbi:MAG: selenocysteine-specific translation elongation factor [Chloroflexi bacterium]|nr:selenocysteine-specific translation elongation factor [Chloroflexota bacterium]